LDRIFILLKRKPGLTFEDFRHHYETSHAVLGEKFFGHLLKSYRRNYTPAGVRFSDHGSVTENAYDCITELIFKDANGSEELRRISNEPAVKQILTDDEERFLDRAACASAPFFPVESELSSPELEP